MSSCCRCPVMNIRPRGAGTRALAAVVAAIVRRTPGWRALADSTPRSPGSAGDDDCRAYGFGHLQVIAGMVPGRPPVALVTCDMLAVATAAKTLVVHTIWMLGDALARVRLPILTRLSIAILTG